MAKNNSCSRGRSAAIAAVVAFLALGLVFISGCTQSTPQQPPAQNITNSTPSLPPGLANETPSLPILNSTNSTNGTGEQGNSTAPNSSMNASGGDVLPVLPGENQSAPNPYAAVKSKDALISTSNFSVPYEPYKPLQIYAINVGYGEAILVRKGEFSMLVDAGPKDSYPALDAFLKKLNIKSIQAVVATRSRADYIGAIPDVLDNYNVEDFWYNNVSSNLPEYAAMMAKVADKRLLVKTPTAGDVMNFNGMSVEALNPFSPRIGNPDSDESDSIVLKVSDKDFCALLMSDAETGTENRIMGAFSDIQCQVIHIGHNGAGTATQASSILARVNPKVAIISVGPNSDANPKSTVLELLRLNGIQTYRTDIDGNILVVSDGTAANYTVSTKQ